MRHYKEGDRVRIDHPRWGEIVVTLEEGDGPRDQPDVIDCFNIVVDGSKTWVDVTDIMWKE